MDQLLTVSQKFWEAMEHADEAGMRACADANCNFVHHWHHLQIGQGD